MSELGVEDVIASSFAFIPISKFCGKVVASVMPFCLIV